MDRGESMAPKRKKPDVFISHAVDEIHVARHLRRELQDASGDRLNIFLSNDPSSLPAGDQWFEQVRSAAVSASSMLILLSPFSMRRRWLSLETGLRLTKGIASAKVFPICCLGSSKGDIAEPWRQMQTLDLSDANDYERFKRIFGDPESFAFAPHDTFLATYSEAEQVAAAELVLNRITGRRANRDDVRSLRDAAFHGNEVTCLELTAAESANLIRIERYMRTRRVVSHWSLTPSSPENFTLSFRFDLALCALARDRLLEVA